MNQINPFTAPSPQVAFGMPPQFPVWPGGAMPQPGSNPGFPQSNQVVRSAGDEQVRLRLESTKSTIGYEQHVRNLHDNLKTSVTSTNLFGTTEDPVLTCVRRVIDGITVDDLTWDQGYRALATRLEDYQAVLGDLVPPHLIEAVHVQRRAKAFNEGTNPSLREDFGEYLRRLANTPTTRGFPTGIEPVDQALGGGIHGLTLVLGDRGIGKTAFLVNCLVEAVVSDPTSAVLFCSYDMDKRSVMDRIVSRKLQVPVADLRPPLWCASTRLRISTEIRPDLLARVKICARTYDVTKDQWGENVARAGIESELLNLDAARLLNVPGVQRVLVVFDLFQKIIVPGRIPVTEEDHYRLDLFDKVKQSINRGFGDGSIAFLVACEMRKRDNVRPATLPTREDIKGDSRIASDADNILIFGDERKVNTDVCDQTLRIDKGRDGVVRGDHALRFHHRVGRYESRDPSSNDTITVSAPVNTSVDPFG